MRLNHYRTWLGLRIGPRGELLIRTGIWSLAFKSSAALNLLGSAALVFRTLGPASFGVWATIMSFVTFAGFLDFGIGNGATTTIYPNPTVDELNVTWKTARRVDIVIYDMSGRAVRRINDREGKFCRINVGGLDRGTYVLRLNGDNGEVGSNKFTKI